MKRIRSGLLGCVLGVPVRLDLHSKPERIVGGTKKHVTILLECRVQYKADNLSLSWVLLYARSCVRYYDSDGSSSTPTENNDPSDVDLFGLTRFCHVALRRRNFGYSQCGERCGEYFRVQREHGKTSGVVDFLVVSTEFSQTAPSSRIVVGVDATVTFLAQLIVSYGCCSSCVSTSLSP